MKNKKGIAPILLIILVIALFFIFLNLATLLGFNRQELTNFNSEDLKCNPRLTDCSWRSELLGYPNSNSVSFQTGFEVKSGVRGGSECIYNVKYEALNQKTNAYTILWDVRNFQIPIGSDSITSVESVRSIGEPQTIWEQTISEGQCSLKAYSTGNREMRCIRKTFTLNQDYITQEGKVNFRTSVSKIGDGCSGGAGETYNMIMVGYSDWTIKETPAVNLPADTEEPITQPVIERKPNLFDKIKNFINQILGWFR